MRQNCLQKSRKREATSSPNLDTKLCQSVTVHVVFFFWAFLAS